MTNYDLILSRVDGWKPLDGSGQPVADSPAEEQSPALACGGPGRLLCVYTRSGADGTVRVVARTLCSQP